MVKYTISSGYKNNYMDIPVGNNQMTTGVFQVLDYISFIAYIKKPKPLKSNHPHNTILERFKIGNL